MRKVLRMAAAACAALAVAAPAARADDAAVRALSQGGQAILMRHAKASGHARAPVPDPEGNCANEDNLGDEGRVQARRLKATPDKTSVDSAIRRDQLSTHGST